MKKYFLVFTMAVGVLTLTSCKGNKQQEAVVEEVTIETPVNEMVKDTIVDAKGNKMYLTFNNPEGLLEVVFNGDTINMMQEITASGIKFNNADYEYEEWQGKIKLKKNGEIVFDNLEK